MTEEQAYAALGRKAVEYAKEQTRYEPVDDCTIRILGMAGLLDQMVASGMFGCEEPLEDPTSAPMTDTSEPAEADVKGDQSRPKWQKWKDEHPRRDRRAVCRLPRGSGKGDYQ